MIYILRGFNIIEVLKANFLMNNDIIILQNILLYLLSRKITIGGNNKMVLLINVKEILFSIFKVIIKIRFIIFLKANVLVLVFIKILLYR